MSRAEEDGSYVFTITSSAKAAAPTPSGDGEEDPSNPNTQGAGNGSNKNAVQNKVVKKVAFIAEGRDLAKTGDSAGAEARPSLVPACSAQLRLHGARVVVSEDRSGVRVVEELVAHAGLFAKILEL